MYVSVKELPDTLRAALSSISYGRADIAIETAETYNPFQAGGAGRRGFCMAVNIESGERAIARGSWGGSNPFNPNNPVDLDSQERPLKPGFAIIQGTEGNGTRATLVL